MGTVNIGAWASVLDNDGNLWISDFHFNGLFKFDLKNNRLSWIAKFDDVPEYSIHLHSAAFYHEKLIFFTPLNDKKVRIYDKDSGIIHSIVIPVDEDISFNKAIRVGDVLYFMSNDCRMWVCDLNERTISEDEELTKLCKGKFAEKSLFFVASEGKMVVWLTEDEILFEVDLVRRTIEIVNVENKTDIEKVQYLDNGYWVYFKGMLDLKKISKDGCEEHYNVEDNCSYTIGAKNLYGDIFEIDEEMYILNYYYDYIMKIDKANKRVTKAFAFPEGYECIEHLGYGGYYMNALKYKDEIIFVPQRGNMLLRYDANTKRINGVKFEMASCDIPYWDEVLLNRIKETKMMVERKGMYVLGDLITYMKKNDYNAKYKVDAIGRKIISII